MKFDSATAGRIIRTFGLRSVSPADPEWLATQASLRANVTASEVWGVKARPTQFRLQDGGQFEYFYLAVTANGELYLLAEYAYG